MKHHLNHARAVHGGFTLVELAVSIGIFAIMSSIVVINYSNFRGSIVLTNIAHEVSLAVRQAQLYGLSVRGGTTDDFDSAFGIHVDVDADPRRMVIFKDVDDDGRFTENDGAELETLQINQGIVIADACILPSDVDSDSDRDCWSSSELDVLDITFKRPDPDARILSDEDVLDADTNSAAWIVLESQSGSRREVVVRVTGQISVQIPE